jgi:DNA-binding NarL/FixJ family response regulator
VTVDWEDAVPLDERGAEGVRVVLADDHDLFRTGLRNLLEEQDVEVIGEAGNGQDAIRCVRELAPEVVVMDLKMPGIGGVEATRQITAIAPLTRVLVLTISDQDNDVLDAILAGACGYLLKDSSIQELMAGIRAAAIGESLISPLIASKVLRHVRSTSSVPAIAETIRAELSDREIEVLKLIANGKDNAQIAAELHISPKRVKSHIRNILMKLQGMGRRLPPDGEPGGESGVAVRPPPRPTPPSAAAAPPPAPEQIADDITAIWDPLAPDDAEDSDEKEHRPS